MTGVDLHENTARKETKQMSVTVKVPPELVERCKKWGEEITTHYRNSGDRLTAMAWTRDQLSDDELRAWLASRKEAANKIDIATCEIGAWYHSVNDEYGIREMLGEQTEEQLWRQEQFRPRAGD